MNGVAVPAAPMSEGPRKPVRVGGEVKPPRLLSGPAPVYPFLAMQSRIQGMVVIEAIIDEHGNVIEVRAISGHPLLIPPAMKAVSQRKYEPTILDGEATPVNLRVEINFHAN
jgi:protein TonB